MLLFPYVQRSSDEGVSISICVCILLCMYITVYVCVALAVGFIRAICNVIDIVLDM